MTGLEIFFIIAGFFCLCISFFVARKGTGAAELSEEGVQTANLWTEKEEQMIRQRVDEILTEQQTQLVDETEEHLNRLCNDKIMAVDEFSKQVLEKIENNHQEVVFMYNMLNEKEKSVKSVVIEPVHVPQPEAEPEPVPEPAQEPVSRTEKTAKPAAARTVTKPKAEPKPAPMTAIEKLSPKAAKKPTAKKKAPEPVEEKTEDVSAAGDVNSQIQKLHREGKSVLEISKALNIGQGEVKLVIALYGGQRK
jgi:outer membrane biosynthesis protein TonB